MAKSDDKQLFLQHSPINSFMKKLLLSLLVTSVFSSAIAQTDYKKLPAFGVHFFFNDFQTASDFRTNGLAQVLSDKQWSKTNRMIPGLALSYLEGLSESVDFAGTLSGSFLDYPFRGGTPTYQNSLLLEAAATVNIKLTSDKYWVSPFLTAGVGASKWQGYYGAFIPAGLGLQVNFLDDAYLLINSQYRIPVTENASYHLYHSIGFAGNIYRPKPIEVAPLPVPPAIVEKPLDSDGDGIADKDDLCPTQAGTAALQGCPDRDGDGIADKDDQCPDEPGLAKYKGCPIPDTDHDGINDEVDKCPTVPGVARYQGCPVPDRDNDGVNDEDDKCPDLAGPASNYGCPEIQKAVVEKINVAAQHILFATGSAKILPASFKSLDNVVTILKENPSYMLDIDGYTDNTGKPEKNVALSDERAKAVLTYIKSKGIQETRLTSKGYGPEKPIADNKTAAGRAKNRRVEIKARNY